MFEHQTISYEEEFRSNPVEFQNRRAKKCKTISIDLFDSNFSLARKFTSIWNLPSSVRCVNTDISRRNATSDDSFKENIFYVARQDKRRNGKCKKIISLKNDVFAMCKKTYK